MGTASIFFHEFPTDRRPTQKKATPTPFGVKVGPLPLKIGLGDRGEKDGFFQIKMDIDEHNPAAQGKIATAPTASPIARFLPLMS